MPRIRKGIYKEKNGTWRIMTNFSIDGHVKTIHLRGFKTESQAYAEKIRIQNMLKSTGINNDAPVLFSDLAEDYFNSYRLKVKESTSANRYSTFKKYFIEKYKDNSVAQVINQDCARTFKMDLIASGLSSDWINKILKYFVEIIDFAYQRTFINSDQFKSTKLELNPIYQDSSEVKIKSIWSKSQFWAFLDTFDKSDRNHVMFHLFGHTGCRIGELRGLQVKHHDRTNKSIFICQQATSKIPGQTKIITLKTSSSIRHVDLSDEMNSILVDYIDTLCLASDDFLFFTSSPKNPIGEETIRRLLKQHIAIANVPEISPHGFRHSNTTWLLSGELSLNDIGQVSKRLGHKNKSMTLDIYYHIHNKSSRNILKNLD